MCFCSTVCFLLWRIKIYIKILYKQQGYNALQFMAKFLNEAINNLTRKTQQFRLLINQENKIKPGRNSRKVIMLHTKTEQISPPTLNIHSGQQSWRYSVVIVLNKHVASLSRSIHFYTRALRHIRPALAESMAATLGASLVQSRLDYANFIMYGMSTLDVDIPYIMKLA